MTYGPALPCPNCQRVLEPSSWHNATTGYCRQCGTDFEFAGFPVLNAAKRDRIAPKAVLVAEHATCFFHGENQAESICDSCGRFLCLVCGVDFNQQKLCPPCIASAQNTQDGALAHRSVFGSFALMLVLAPLAIFPLIAFTAITAPAALGVVCYAWRKP